MKRLLFPLLLLSLPAMAQEVNWKKIREADPDKILLAGDRQPTKVLLLGTFHFAYPNLDAHKTDSSKFIDVLSAARQRELEQLAEVIARFRPTRIYIESSKPAFHDSLYSEYRKGRYKLGRNENYQIGYRLAGNAGLPRVYPVDATNLAYDYSKRFSAIDSLWTAAVPVDSLRDRYWSSKFKAFYTAGDSIETTLSMLENFLLMAEPKVMRRMHGAYLVSGFNTEYDNGPDALSIWWYNRNLRIFNRILQTKPTAEDRIVVLFGNGHMPLLRHCFESSPEFEVVELKSLLK